MNPTTSTRSYYPALDGLRGIAILLVICCHNFNFLPNFEFGWIGVDLFFVLSGFLITDILLRTRNEKNFLQNFYLRRIVRIFPLYYGVLLLFFIIAPGSDRLQIQYNYYQSNQSMLWLHLQNWLTIFHISPSDTALLGHFWSLSVEEQFYLVWPIIILAVKNTRLLAQIALLVFVTCILSRFSSWLYFGDGYTNFYFQYTTRLDGLCIGSLIAIWKFSPYEQTQKKLLRLALSVFAIHIALIILSKKVFIHFPHFTFLGYSTIAVIFGLVVFNVIDKRSPLSKLFLENNAIKFIGKISYGLYVYHWPVLALCKIYLVDEMSRFGFSSYSGYAAVSLFALMVTFVLSICSYYFFEKKLLALKDRITEEGFFTRAWKKMLVLFRFSSAR